jgi:hypothetical protein
MNTALAQLAQLLNFARLRQIVVYILRDAEED